MEIEPSYSTSIKGSGRWLGRYLSTERAGLHTFLMGSHTDSGSTLIHLLPPELIQEVFSNFLRPLFFRVVGLTTPWNEEGPWTDNKWCMEVTVDPYTGAVLGEGTNIGMTIVKKYSGFLRNNVMNCHVHFPATEQKSSYKGSVDAQGILELRIEIEEAGKTSGIKGDFTGDTKFNSYKQYCK